MADQCLCKCLRGCALFHAWPRYVCSAATCTYSIGRCLCPCVLPMRDCHLMLLECTRALVRLLLGNLASSATECVTVHFHAKLRAGISVSTSFIWGMRTAPMTDQCLCYVCLGVHCFMLDRPGMCDAAPTAGVGLPRTRSQHAAVAPMRGGSGARGGHKLRTSALPLSWVMMGLRGDADSSGLSSDDSLSESPSTGTKQAPTSCLWSVCRSWCACAGSALLSVCDRAGGVP